MDPRLDEVTWEGPPPADAELLERLPAALRALLERRNGWVAYRGGLHVRGASLEPAWHSLREAWEGDAAIHRLFPEARPDDVPFAQDALGDQYLLRGDVVHRLAAEAGEVESLDLPLDAFLAAAAADPEGFLSLEPLLHFLDEGGTLEPGQLLSAYPPFITEEARAGVSLRPMGAAERLGFLSSLAADVAGLGGSRERARPAAGDAAGDAADG